MREDKRYRDNLYAVCDRLLKIRREKGRALCSIDGRCGSGKSSFAHLVSREIAASLIHADDFYLQPFQRTKERYAEPGGNLDRERLLSEVILPFSEGKEISYRIFDPRIMDFSGTADIGLPGILIIEGSYSSHPDLRGYYDLTVFCDVPPDEQLRRILLRNGAEKQKQFRERWIPLEELYFSGMDVRNGCDMAIDM